MPYKIRKQKCKKSDGSAGSYVLAYTDKKGKKHSNCHTSKKRARGQIAAIEAESIQLTDDSLNEFTRTNEMTKNEKLLREFIYWNSKDSDAPEKKDRREMGILDKIKGFLKGTTKADELTNDWLDDTEMSYGIEVPSDIEEEAKKIVRAKLEDVMSRTRGDFDKAERIIKRALDKRFAPRIKELEKQLLDDEEEASKI